MGRFKRPTRDLRETLLRSNWSRRDEPINQLKRQASTMLVSFYTFGHLNRRIFGDLSVTKATLPRSFQMTKGVNVHRCITEKSEVNYNASYNMSKTLFHSINNVSKKLNI